MNKYQQLPLPLSEKKTMDSHIGLAPQATITRRRQPIRRRAIFFPMITLGLGTMVAVVIAEVALRLFVHQEAQRKATYDETLGWRGRPHGTGVYIRKADNIRVSFRYNNLGFRDEDVTPKPVGGRRILLLGDSFVDNLEVEYSRTFPALLEQRVKERSAEWDVAVVGSQGYSTAQELLAFRKYHEVVSPDVVLLCFYCGNDFQDNLRPKFAYLDDSGELQLPPNAEPQWRHNVRRLQRWTYESFQVVALLKNSLESMTNINLVPDAKSAKQADPRYTQEITRKLICQLAEEVHGSGAEFRVVVIPSRDDVLAGTQEGQSFVTEVCAGKKIAALDLSSLLAANTFFETDIHFNAEGHQIVADAIYEFLAGSLASTHK